MYCRVYLASNRLRPSVLHSCLKDTQSRPGNSPKEADVAVVEIAGPDDVRSLKAMRREHPRLLILVLVPFGNVELEKQAIRGGADDVLTLPMSAARLRLTLINMMRLVMLQRIMGASARLAAA